MADRYVPPGETSLSAVTLSNNDTLIFAYGSQHVNENMDLTSRASGVTVEVWPGFTGTIGDADNSLKFDGATLTVKGGGGEIHFQPTSAQNVEGIGAMKINIKGGGTVALLDVANSFVSVTADVTVNNIRKRGGDMTVGYRSTKLQSVRAAGGGSFTCERGLSGVAVLVNQVTTLGRLRPDLTVPAIDGSEFTVMGGAINFKGLSASTIGLEAHDTKIDAGQVTGALTLSGFIDAMSAYKSQLASAFVTVTTSDLTEYGGDSDQDFGFVGNG